MSAAIHWQNGAKHQTVCGWSGYTTPGIAQVTCRVCLTDSTEYRELAVARLAELDRKGNTERQDRYVSFTPTWPVSVNLDPFTLQNYSNSLNATTKPITLSEIKAAVAALKSPPTKNTPDARDALLLRASSFIADLPSGSLDRARNVEAQAIRRAIADLVVGKDKVSK